MNRLVADIGGTNTRCAVTGPDGRMSAVSQFENRDYETPAPLLKRFLDSLAPGDRPDSGLLAVAAPIVDDVVHMVNIDWHFSTGALAGSLDLRALRTLNDFEALAWALPELEPGDLLRVGGGRIRDGRPKAVLGPGTGLGVASLVHADTGWLAVCGEGGHVTLPAVDALEARVIDSFRESFGHCSAERVLSGPGLGLLHRILHGGPAVEAAEVARLADNDDAAAAETFEVFFRLLGTVAANLALTVGAFGGVYIGGGIVPRHRDRFMASGFRERFESKGRYGDYLQSIPTFLIVSDHPTLTGLAALGRRSGRSA
ncbi:MAG: glucokinase [Gammaproteobacteria bacterium]